MSETSVPEELRYSKSHEWVRAEGEIVTVGITDYAQAELTDIVFVELPSPGKVVAAGATVMVLESVKTVTDIYAPAAGTVSEVNEDLKSHPELVNKEPYGRGWLFRLRSGTTMPEDLLSAAQYRDFVAKGA